MDKSPALEEFRKTVLPRYIEKGVEPPEHESKAESELYKLWLSGRKKLNQNNNGYQHSILFTRIRPIRH